MLPRDNKNNRFGKSPLTGRTARQLAAAYRNNSADQPALLFTPFSTPGAALAAEPRSGRQQPRPRPRSPGPRSAPRPRARPAPHLRADVRHEGRLGRPGPAAQHGPGPRRRWRLPALVLSGEAAEGAIPRQRGDAEPHHGAGAAHARPRPQPRAQARPRAPPAISATPPRPHGAGRASLSARGGSGLLCGPGCAPRALPSACGVRLEPAAIPRRFCDFGVTADLCAGTSCSWPVA